MFELIGLVVATLVLFFVATLVGGVFAAIAWLTVRKRDYPRWKYVLLAAAIPIVSAAYLWMCVAILPGETMFNDISEKLPNGYSLQGLGKMPDFAEIVTRDSLNGQTPLPECIDSLQVIGPLVVGQFSHPAGTFNPAPQEPYFIFDTQTGKNIVLKSQPEVESQVGRPVQLVPSQFFRSSEPSAIRQRKIDNAVMFVPPILLSIFYFVWLFRLPHSEPEHVGA